MWDMGGQHKLRQLWRQFYVDADGIIFVIDSNDTYRLDEAKLELETLQKESDLVDVPFLIMANKQDLPNAQHVDEIGGVLEVDRKRQVRKIKIQPCCAKSGGGVFEGFDWLSNTLREG